MTRVRSFEPDTLSKPNPAARGRGRRLMALTHWLAWWKRLRRTP